MSKNSRTQYNNFKMSDLSEEEHRVIVKKSVKQANKEQKKVVDDYIIKQFEQLEEENEFYGLPYDEDTSNLIKRFIRDLI